MLVDHDSLAATLSNLNQATLERRALPQSERDGVASFLLSRMGERGSYGGLPAPTSQDFRKRLRLFTGETIGSRAGTSCKLGFEAAWALLTVASRQAAAVSAAEECRRLTVAMFARERPERKGLYCCHSCSVAGWRVLGLCSDREGAGLLDAAMARLHGRRDGKGRWRGFPFWYTLLTLGGLHQPRAVAELRYSAPVLERSLAGEMRGDLHRQRRRLLAERILAQI